MPKILPNLLFMVALATAVAFLHERYPDSFPSYTAVPFRVFGGGVVHRPQLPQRRLLCTLVGSAPALGAV